MIYGEGVSVKYGVIVAGRRAELFAGLSLEDQEAKLPELSSFIAEVKHSTPTEFEQWYELYVDAIVENKGKKK